MFRLMFTENGRTIIRNFVEVRFYDAYGRLRKLQLPSGTFILMTGDGNTARVLDFVANPFRDSRGEPTVSVFNVLMFALGVTSAAVWDLL